MNDSTLPSANRILIIDDNPAIHEDFRKILAPQRASDATLRETEQLLFGQVAGAGAVPVVAYQIDSASQGQEGLQMVEQAAGEGCPYALAFVDVRMPPGWDGIETIARIWKKHPELPVVICTAYSDYSWTEMMSSLGHSDNLVILRKPFEAVEVLQLAHSFTRKWMLARQVQAHIEELDGLVLARTRNLQEVNEALRRSEERFAKAFQANPVPLALQRINEQRYVDINNSFCQLTGFKREEILGQTAGGLKLFLQPETEGKILETLSTRRPVANLQTGLRMRDGKHLTVLISAEALELENQPHLLMSIQDITDRLNIENQLRQAQKMEAVGQIAAGIAHDFNNILTVIQCHSEMQLKTGNLEESLADSLNEISRAAARAAALTRQLLAFSRKQMLQRRPLDVRQSLDSLGKMLKRIIGEHIQLRVQCPENLPPIFADAINFEQIIINLAVNARDAMPRGGPLTITAGLVTVDSGYKEREPDALLGIFMRLSVADEGTGMDEKVRRKIFEPFFSTKEVGKGTGMGLATVYGIVKQHQGWIEVDTKIGVGSVFRVFLPLTDKEVQNESALRPSQIWAAKVEPRTILVVEDETPLREMAAKILKRFGHQALVAKDGPEGYDLWRQHRGKIDLLFTDMVMPGGMTGRELADLILREEPRMPVIYSTGYSMDLSNSGIRLVEGVNFLRKPYDATTLVQAVKTALAQSAKPPSDDGSSRQV